jgi:hypothetical protein
MSAHRPDAARWVEGVGGPLSPFRVMGADGEADGSGVVGGPPDSESHSERLSGRRAVPSHDGGPFDQVPQPPSCDAMTQMMNSRRHIVLMPLSLSIARLPATIVVQAAVVPCDRVRRILPPCRPALIAARPWLADQRAPA